MTTNSSAENSADGSPSGRPLPRVHLHPFSKARRIVLALLLLASAATAWWLLHAALPETSAAPQRSLALNPGYQHTQRLMVSTARAALDAVAMSGGGADTDSYRMDYSMQKTQIQADSEGLERWAAHDPRHQGLLHAIQVSLHSFLAILDHPPSATAMAPMHGDSAMSMQSAPVLIALDRVQQALSNYSASMVDPGYAPPAHLLFAGPMLLWWILLLLLLELAVIAWLIFPVSLSAKGRR